MSDLRTGTLGLIALGTIVVLMIIFFAFAIKVAIDGEVGM